jgi:hypothetical protein
MVFSLWHGFQPAPRSLRCALDFRLRHALTPTAWPYAYGMVLHLRQTSARAKADGLAPSVSIGLQRSVST